jgi:hypothetical protein
LLEQKNSQEGIKFSISRRRRKIYFLGGLSIWRSSGGTVLSVHRVVAARSAEVEELFGGIQSL